MQPVKAHGVFESKIAKGSFNRCTYFLRIQACKYFYLSCFMSMCVSPRFPAKAFFRFPSARPFVLRGAKIVFLNGRFLKNLGRLPLRRCVSLMFHVCFWDARLPVHCGDLALTGTNKKASLSIYIVIYTRFFHCPVHCVLCGVCAWTVFTHAFVCAYHTSQIRITTHIVSPLTLAQYLVICIIRLESE